MHSRRTLGPAACLLVFLIPFFARVSRIFMSLVFICVLLKPVYEQVWFFKVV